MAPDVRTGSCPGLTCEFGGRQWADGKVTSGNTALSAADGGRMQITVLAAQIGWERSRVSHHVRRMSARAW